MIELNEAPSAQMKGADPSGAPTSVSEDSPVSGDDSEQATSDGSVAADRAVDEAAASIDEALRRADFPRAIELCAQQHGAVLGRLCAAMVGDPAEAEELAQDTLLSAFQTFSSFRAESSVRSWLCGIARKKCLKALEAKRRAQRHQPTVRQLTPTIADAQGEQWMQLRQRGAAARAALAKVRPSEREALLLRYVGELSYRELGAVFDLDEAAVRKRVSRGLQQLRAMVAQSGERVAEQEEA